VLWAGVGVGVGVGAGAGAGTDFASTPIIRWSCGGPKLSVWLFVTSLANVSCEAGWVGGGGVVS